MKNFTFKEAWADDTPETRQALEDGLSILAKIIARRLIRDSALREKSFRESDGDSKNEISEVIMPHQEEKRLTLSIRETSELLGLSKNSIYEAIHAGKIPSIKFGRKIIIPYKAVVNMLDMASTP